MGRWFHQHLGPLIFGVVGVVFLIVGVGLSWGSYATGQQAKAVASLPLVNAEQLSQLAAGQQVGVEGRISERNTAAYEGLVIYTARRFRGIECDRNSNDNTRSNCKQVWDEVERVAPAIWLDVPGGRLRLANANYALYHPPEQWQNTPFPIEGRTLEYSGFRVGSPVFVSGTIDPAGDALRADFLSGGDRAAYLAGEQQSAGILLIIGLIFGGLGLLFAGIGMAWGFWA